MLEAALTVSCCPAVMFAINWLIVAAYLVSVITRDFATQMLVVCVFSAIPTAHPLCAGEWHGTVTGIQHQVLCSVSQPVSCLCQVLPVLNLASLLH